MPAATTSSRDAKTRSGAISGSKNGKATNRRGHRYGRIMREGDEEIVREAHSDDGSSQGDSTDEGESASQSSVTSLRDSHLQSSNRSDQRPDLSNGHTSATSDPSEAGPSSGTSFLEALRAARLDWSDTVQESEGDVQIVQFDKLDELNVEEVGNDPEDSKYVSKGTQRGRPQSFKRPIGMSARQVYLKRLENDPAYIPRVGEFWGHDERLLDKDLRSLSGWWRGKWTGRGGFSSRGGNRGRIAAHTRNSVHGPSEEEAAISSQNRSDPVEQTWKHDGFEEMTKDEETLNRTKRLPEGRERSGSWVANRGNGRGGIANAVQNRNGRSQSFASPQDKLHPLRPFGHGRAQSMSWNRYEYAWTKHSVAFLFQDALTKARNGDDMPIRVRMPGQNRYNIVRVPHPQREDGRTTDSNAKASLNRTIVVRLPKSATRSPDPRNERTVVSPPIPEEAQAVALTISHDASLPTAEAVTSSVALSTPVTETDSATKPPETPMAEVQQADQTIQISDKPSIPDRGVPPSVQLITNLSNVAPSPAYSSPTYAPGYQYPLPRPAPSFSANGAAPGDAPVWFDPRMPYGYPTPPPLPGHMYTPPPPAPVHHVHHHSHSMSHPHNYPHIPQMAPYYPQNSLAIPEYQQMQPVSSLAPPQLPMDHHHHPPTFTYSADGAMIDPQTGVPIFSPAKPSTKVAIRKPDVLSGEAPESNSVQESNINGGTNGTLAIPATDGRKEIRNQVATHYIPPQLEFAPTGFSPNEVSNPPHPAFWNAYPPQGGYYYPPQGYGIPPHEYPQFQPPLHVYMPGPHGEADYQQPPVYY
ncbi:hypothetical protein FRC19_005761 [Serendipita sp. 401]|nr:hypothetical protein FRC19_005761 [Serendipita sp. 401]KAG9057529.1 hypothetical protein FS842_006059 [Serendipita sp. 407]